MVEWIFLLEDAFWEQGAVEMINFMLDNGGKKSFKRAVMFCPCRILIRKNNSIRSFDHTPDVFERETPFQLDAFFNFRFFLCFFGTFALSDFGRFFGWFFKLFFNDRIDKCHKRSIWVLFDNKKLERFTYLRSSQSDSFRVGLTHERLLHVFQEFFKSLIYRFNWTRCKG